MKFGDEFVLEFGDKFGESPNWGQICPQICPQKAREHIWKLRQQFRYNGKCWLKVDFQSREGWRQKWSSPGAERMICTKFCFHIILQRARGRLCAKVKFRAEFLHVCTRGRVEEGIHLCFRAPILQRSSSHGLFCTERRRRRSQIPGIPAFLLLSCHVHHWSRSKTTLHFETCLTMYKSWRWKVNFRTEPFCIAATPQILNVPAFLILSWYVHHWKKKKKFVLETWNSIFYVHWYSQQTNFRIVQCKLKEPQRKYTQCILVMVRLVAFFISLFWCFILGQLFQTTTKGFVPEL